MYIPGEDIKSRLLRKTLCQNCNLMIVLLFQTISESVRTKLKTLQDVVDAGTPQWKIENWLFCINFFTG